MYEGKSDGIFDATSGISLSPSESPGLWALILDLTANPYDFLRDIELTSLAIKVDVKGVKDLVLQSDSSSIDSGKAFLPFGPRPVVGSKFYMGSNEVFQKSLTDLSVNIL